MINYDLRHGNNIQYFLRYVFGQKRLQDSPPPQQPSLRPRYRQIGLGGGRLRSLDLTFGIFCRRTVAAVAASGCCDDLNLERV